MSFKAPKPVAAPIVRTPPVRSEAQRPTQEATRDSQQSTQRRRRASSARPTVLSDGEGRTVLGRG